jgi:PleD family two-component response regulator
LLKTVLECRAMAAVAIVAAVDSKRSIRRSAAMPPMPFMTGEKCKCAPHERRTVFDKKVSFVTCSVSYSNSSTSVLKRRPDMARDSRRVLVIEDDPGTAKRLADCLRTAGYDVDLAFDGDEGSALSRAANYVVMIVDRMLPRIDGIEVIRQLRQNGIVTPTLIVSA